MAPVKPLSPAKLRWHCSEDCIETTSGKTAPFYDIIGQPRAVEALRMGLQMKQAGFNVFVTGLSGTGRMTTVKRMLQEIESKGTKPDDLCYVNNFKNLDQPMAISLQAGKGKSFRADVNRLVDSLTKGIPAVFESDEYQQARKKVAEKFNQRRQAIIGAFEKDLSKQGFKLIQVQMGPFVRPDVLPVIEDQPTQIEQLEAWVQEKKFPKKKLDEIRKKREKLMEEMVHAFKDTKQIDREMQDALDELSKSVISPIIHDMIVTIQQKYDNKKLAKYLDSMEEYIMDNLSRFQSSEEETNKNDGKESEGGKSDSFQEFRVNVIVDNSETKGSPVIIETSPTYRNLFGSIERIIDRSGVWRTDFTKIKAGSFLRANGGYLVINALDALVEQGVWDTLKRTLRNRKVEILTYDPFFNMFTGSLKPEPIDVNVKVVMIGEPFIYYLLRERDFDFAKIFKVKAEFDTEMPRTEESIREYVSFVRMISHENKLMQFRKNAITELIEFGVKLAGMQHKLSTRFNIISDVMSEADYWARQDNAKTVTDKHVRNAIDAWKERVNLIEDKIQERIYEGTLYIDTAGAVVGQINGLSVYDLGEYMFGIPSRITAQTSMGRSGVVNIEREAEMSGPTHSKGVMIISGYLQGKFAQDKPMSMNASICFEQSYGGVDGDSASSTEIYAILSRLADAPIRQDLAVTGSVNQLGKIQPIGGVNEKIEGFYRVCKERGFTGTQGVVIPKANVDDLMLKQEVINAVGKGKFNIYPIETIEQGVELLMGMPAGTQNKKGQYPVNTVFGKADAKLRAYAELIKEYGGEKQE
jgi:lon-related putative ATP-dependent protease